MGLFCDAFYDAESYLGGRKGMHIEFWWESQKERDHWEDLDVGEKIILKWASERWDGLVWTGLSWLRRGTSGGLL
jgi:hypothetical protein